jgi:hypothetical protein
MRNAVAPSERVRHAPGMVADLRWDEVRPLFDPELMGSLPDLCVPDVSVAGWQALLDLVALSGWEYRYAEGGTALPLPRVAEVLSRPPDAACPELRMWPAPAMLAIFRFMAADEIDFDVDLRELRSQQRLDLFCDFLRAVGRYLGRPVLMDAEGGDPRSHPVLRFDADADRFTMLAEPPT